MENLDNLPWWRTALRVAAGFFGLLALSAALMGGILLTARIFDSPGSPTQAAPIHISSTAPAVMEQNARTRGASTYGFDIMTNSPGRPAGVGFKTNPNNSGAAPSRTAGATERASDVPQTPVGVSVEEYRATVDSGKKVFLPNPKGECDLSGESVTKSASGLENCFAQRAAR